MGTILNALLAAVNAGFAMHDFATGHPALGAFSGGVAVFCSLMVLVMELGR